MNVASDSLVFSIRIKSVTVPLPTVAIVTLLQTISIVFIAALADGIPLRGGADFGFAMDLPESKEVFGPAIAEAVALEKLAEHPRVLVGESLMKHLDWAASESNKNALDRQFAEPARDCIMRDSDGRYAVDYLKVCSGMVALNHAIVVAFGFVKSERERFRNDAKLGPRYEKVLRYFSEGAERLRPGD